MESREIPTLYLTYVFAESILCSGASPADRNDKPVSDMVKDCKEYPAFMEKLTDMLEFLIPNYLKEGKNQLVISVGCTGGKHRSVTVANALYETLEKLPYTVRLYHRDIGKDRIVKGE